MRNFRFAFVLTAAAVSIFAGTMWLAAHSASAASKDNDTLSADTYQELARARAATARFHNIDQALLDGYVQASPDIPGEGFHYVNFSLVDCEFNPETPEVLHYGFVPNEKQLHLLGVEYVAPIACGEPPDGFTGDADEWEQEAGGPPLFSLNAWIWRNNPEGIFAAKNPLVP